jgi:FdhD protein
MFPPPIQPVTAIRYPQGNRIAEQLVVEEPVEIRVDAEPLATTMRTPGADEELAAGFCLSEGIVDHPDDLERVEACTLADYGNVVNVTLAGDARQRWHQTRTEARRTFFLSSSCGLCGTRTLDRLEKAIRFPPPSFQIRPAQLLALPTRMTQTQTAFTRTGGLHASAFFAPSGELRLLREDVGRHNALDQVIGAFLLSGQLPCGPGVLLLSGRVSFELVQKAARAGIGFIAAVGAPSSLAVAAAERFGITLVGFLREGRFTAYANPERVQAEE